MVNRITTVCGDIDPDSIGPTLMHEHILCDLTPPGKFLPDEPDGIITMDNRWEINYNWSDFPGNSRLNQEEMAVRELKLLKECGMNTVVELSSEGLKRNPKGLRRIAEELDLNIIMGCGYYIESYLNPDLDRLTPDQIAREIIADIQIGVDNTGIKAGIIGEIGCSGEWTPLERKVMHAAVTAQKETGISMNIHPHRSSRAPFEILDYIRMCGGSPERTIISHIDRTIFDLPTLFRLADTGCIIEFDFFGIESSYYPFQPSVDLPNDGMRLNAIKALIDRGNISQVLISQDICTKTRLAGYGGHGYSHIPKNIVPLMKIKGFSQEDISTIIIENPRRLLSGK